MKRILLLIMAAMPLVCSAQYKYKSVKNNDAYGKGAVVTTDEGRACVARSITIPNMSIARIWATVDALYGKNGVALEAPAKYTETGREATLRTYRIEDELVFNSNFINSDASAMSARLIITLNIKGNATECIIALDNIHYRITTAASTTTGMPHEKWTSGYSVADSGVRIVPAEEYITDEVALTRSGSLVRSLAKYRVCTIDYVQNIAETISEAIQKQLDK